MKCPSNEQLNNLPFFVVRANQSKAPPSIPFTRKKLLPKRKEGSSKKVELVKAPTDLHVSKWLSIGLTLHPACRVAHSRTNCRLQMCLSFLLESHLPTNCLRCGVEKWELSTFVWCWFWFRNNWPRCVVQVFFKRSSSRWSASSPQSLPILTCKSLQFFFIFNT